LAVRDSCGLATLVLVTYDVGFRGRWSGRGRVRSSILVEKVDVNICCRPGSCQS